jgi:hypothetical protein
MGYSEVFPHMNTVGNDGSENDGMAEQWQAEVEEGRQEGDGER